MSTSPKPRKNGLQNTYFVQDRNNKEELARLSIQDQMITASMGGVLPEQADPTLFHQVLDVACGTAGWAIEAAKTYPTIALVGIDINEHTITYAQQRAATEQVADRVQFHVMDTLRPLDFPPASFDLVNLRLALSFTRTWDWPNLINELQRVTRPGGILRLTEADISTCNSPSLTRLHQHLLQAFSAASNFFRPQNDGLTSELPSLLLRHGLGNVQTRTHILIYRASTPEGQHYAENVQYLYRTLRPFLEKWTQLPADYDALYQQALSDMQQPDFVATWRFVTIWGHVSTSRNTSPGIIPD